MNTLFYLSKQPWQLRLQQTRMMPMIKKADPLLHDVSNLLIGALIALMIVALAGCGNDKQESAADNRNGDNLESFTFFDLGPDTLYSDATRRSLEKKLGNDAISHRNMIKIKINDSEFLKRYFPDLYELNRQLNSSIGSRIDHDTIKLMYRYARKRDVPFEYVEILFSNYSKLPLLIDIRFGRDVLGTVDRLKEKYGAPKEVEWEGGTGRTLFWKKNRDYLVVSMVPDQFGDIEHEVTIYFAENLQNLVAKEQAEKQRIREERSKSVNSAF